MPGSIVPRGVLTMRGLFAFIKNNRIIYKISIVSFLIIMLICVVQIYSKENNNTYEELKSVAAKNIPAPSDDPRKIQKLWQIINISMKHQQEPYIKSLQQGRKRQ